MVQPVTKHGPHDAAVAVEETSLGFDGYPAAPVEVGPHETDGLSDYTD